MSSKFIYCNDCPKGNSQWKIVESSARDAILHSYAKNVCQPCKQKKSHCKENSTAEHLQTEYVSGGAIANTNNCNQKNDCNQNCYVDNRCNQICKPICPCPPPPKCIPMAATVVSVKNPQSELVIPQVVGAPAVGVAAVNDQPIVGPTVDLTGWTNVVIDVQNAFNTATGTYTAPTAGDYEIALVVNYETSVPLAVDTALTNVPTIELYDPDTGARFVGSQFPSISTIITIPPISSGDLPIDVTVSFIISRAIVTINTILPLTAGQKIRARALSNGLTYTPPFTVSQVIPALPPRIVFDPVGADTTMTVKKIRNTPVINYTFNNCNNIVN